MRHRYLPAARRIAVLLVAVILAVGATTLVTTDLISPHVRLAYHRWLWTKQAMHSYQFTIQLLCFCHRTLDPILITVENGVTTAITNTIPGKQVHPAEFEREQSVEQLFNRIQEALDRNPDKIYVRYDPIRGYPTFMRVDYNQTVYDDEMEYGIKSLMPIRPAP